MRDANERLAAAEAAVDLRQRDADAAVRVARDLLDERDDDEAAVLALRVLAMSDRLSGHLTTALATARRALRLANRRGLPYRAAEARMTLMLILAERGQTEAALKEGELAAEVLQGQAGARLKAQLAVVLHRTGRVDEALANYMAALPVLQEHGDERWVANVLNALGILEASRGDHRAARRHLRECADIAERVGLQTLYALAVGNLGFALLRAGDIPGALAQLDRTIEISATFGQRTGSFLIDKAEALLLAGIAREARLAVGDAIAENSAGGWQYDLAEAHLLLARAALADDDPTGALEAARTALRAFTRQRRPPWASYARHVEITARYALGERTTRLLREAVANADRLSTAGWTVVPEQSRLLAARVALDLRKSAQATAMLAAVARHRSRGPAELRATAWHAETLRLLAAGDHGRARRALRRGLRVLRENAATLGATDLRAHAAIHGEELATLGTRLAVRHGTARAVLSWSEEWRAAALRQRPVRPPDDERLAADLAELRRVVAEIDTSAMELRDARSLRAERLRLERSIRDRSRHARGSYAPEQPFAVDALVAALGERAFVEYVNVDDELYAITLTSGSARLHRLGSYEQAMSELDSLRFAMRRSVLGFGSGAVRTAGRIAYEYSRSTLDRLLLAPLRGVLADRELVVVPTGRLHALPWPLLASAENRPLTVAPSARTWLTTVRETPHVGSGTALVAGPGLAHAEAEIDELAERYRDAIALTGEHASVDKVSKAIDGVRLAHIASHGHFRTDNPLFSCVDLADGPLTVYDLERLERAPHQLVLSACDSALSGIRPGNEIMGLTSAVFALGTATVIASVVPVGDEDSRRLMIELHRRLDAGDAPAHALAGASTATGVTGFVCFGAG
jgi:tetratricopeptide (TPR) repeat protein